MNKFLKSHFCSHFKQIAIEIVKVRVIETRKPGGGKSYLDKYLTVFYDFLIYAMLF